jgi:hypothetical protein
MLAEDAIRSAIKDYRSKRTKATGTTTANVSFKSILNYDKIKLGSVMLI